MKHFYVKQLSNVIIFDQPKKKKSQNSKILNILMQFDCMEVCQLSRTLKSRRRMLATVDKNLQSDGYDNIDVQKLGFNGGAKT